MTQKSPLALSQIEAALRLFDRLRGWRATNQALASLQVKFPAFDLPSTLLKVSTVNALYGTRLMAVVRMAEHATTLIHREGARNLDIDFVPRLADLDRNGKRMHLSFASKFAHFFIDPERFPILDRFAEKMVRHHLGSWSSHRETRYQRFVSAFLRLKNQTGYAGSNADFDKYLWLAGAYLNFDKRPADPLNFELKRWFQSAEPDVRDDLGILVSKPVKQDAILA